MEKTRQPEAPKGGANVADAAQITPEALAAALAVLRHPEYQAKLREFLAEWAYEQSQLANPGVSF